MNKHYSMETRKTVLEMYQARKPVKEISQNNVFYEINHKIISFLLYVLQPQFWHYSCFSLGSTLDREGFLRDFEVSKKYKKPGDA